MISGEVASTVPPERAAPQEILLSPFVGKHSIETKASHKDIIQYR